MLLSLFLWASLSIPSNGQAHVDTALVYVGAGEITENWSPEIKRFLASVGLSRPTPYCAAFLSFCLDQAGGIKFPTVRTALASKFISRRSIKASYVLRGRGVERGTILIWKKGNTIFGHAGLVLSWDGACGVTVEANTSSGRYGNQRDGDGVWVRERCIEPANYFRIVAFSPVIYEKPTSNNPPDSLSFDCLVPRIGRD